MDLTGIWTANDGSIYAIRQVGDAVWWVGLSDPFEFHRGTRFTNVFSGQLQVSPLRGTTISGSWIDVPRGGASNSGSLVLQVGDPSVFTGPVRPGLLKEPFEAAALAREPNGGGGDGGGGEPNGDPPSTPQPPRLIRISETGGFGPSLWRQTGDPVHHLDIVTRFNLTAQRRGHHARSPEDVQG